MASTELTGLATTIDALLRDYQKIRQENDLLREKLYKLTMQEEGLKEKNRKASGRIKQIINQLREEIYE